MQTLDTLKEFADKHNLLYRTDTSRDGLHEAYVYSTESEPLYRYAFACWWDDDGPLALWVGVNPAKGDTEKRPRPTRDRCVRRSRAMGATGLIVANLFAARHNEPRGLRTTSDPVGPYNDQALTELNKIADWTIVAWGGQGRLGRERAAQVALLLTQSHCLGVTVKGDPRHPLYVKRDVLLRKWPI